MNNRTNRFLIGQKVTFKKGPKLPYYWGHKKPEETFGIIKKIGFSFQARIRTPSGPTTETVAIEMLDHPTFPDSGSWCDIKGNLLAPAYPFCNEELDCIVPLDEYTEREVLP